MLAEECLQGIGARQCQTVGRRARTYGRPGGAAGHTCLWALHIPGHYVRRRASPQSRVCGRASLPQPSSVPSLARHIPDDAGRRRREAGHGRESPGRCEDRGGGWCAAPTHRRPRDFNVCCGCEVIHGRNLASRLPPSARSLPLRLPASLLPPLLRDTPPV